MPSLCQSKSSRTYEDLDTSEALERICGSSSLESLPGFRPTRVTTPPPLPPRQKGLVNPPPPVPPPSLKKGAPPLNSVASNKENCPMGQSPAGTCRKQLFESGNGGNKRRLFKSTLKCSLKKSKLTPVKLFLAASPFLRRKGGVACPTSPQDQDGQKETSFERRQNLECLKEARTYDLPIIPFPYTPTNTPHQILSAATEGPNFRYVCKLTRIPLRETNFQSNLFSLQTSKINSLYFVSTNSQKTPL